MKSFPHLGTLCAAALLGLVPAIAAPGDLDPLDFGVTRGAKGMAVAVQPDGKIIIGGYFKIVQGVERLNIARINADGTLDTGFDPCISGAIKSLAVQGDGKILVAGRIGDFRPNGADSPITRRGIARLNTEGTLDAGFDPNADNEVNAMAVQADGKIWVAGNFRSFQSNGAISQTTRRCIARLNADGTLDMGYDPNPDNIVICVAIQADGKVLLGGAFTKLQPNGADSPTPRKGIARVNADGTLDVPFDPNPGRYVTSIAVQADGKVLLGGDFDDLQPNGAATATRRTNLARVNPDGTLDTNFDPEPDDTVHTMTVQADGKVLLGGRFQKLKSSGATDHTDRRFIARIHPDGKLDTCFDLLPDLLVMGLTVQADGQVLVGGYFNGFLSRDARSGFTRRQFARLQNDVAPQRISAPDPTRALWTRGGAAPEVSNVTFELSTDDGSTWIPLGDATRIGTTADWEGAALSLPASGLLRARGRVAGGVNNGSSHLIEQVVPFSFMPPDANDDGLLDSFELTR